MISVLIVGDDLTVACRLAQLFNWCGAFLAKPSGYIYWRCNIHLLKKAVKENLVVLWGSLRNGEINQTIISCCN